jgi:hypothetical protein
MMLRFRSPAGLLLLLLCFCLTAAAWGQADLGNPCSAPVSFNHVQLNSEGVWQSPSRNLSTRGCVVRMDAALQAPFPAVQSALQIVYLQITMRSIDGRVLAGVQQTVDLADIVPSSGGGSVPLDNSTVVACPEENGAEESDTYSFLATGTPGAFFSFTAASPRAELQVPFSQDTVFRVDQSYVRTLFFTVTLAVDSDNKVQDTQLAMLHVGARAPTDPYKPRAARFSANCPDTATIQYSQHHRHSSP